MGPCQHGMARPQVADGVDGHQVWRVAAIILNRQPWTADKGWSSRLGVGRGAHNSLLRNVTHGFRIGLFGTT
jgi:hypothetical protein